MTTKFALIADPHFGFPRYRGDTNFDSAGIVTRTVKALNKVTDLEFGVQLGDLINENVAAPNAEHDTLSMKRVLGLLSELNAPLYHLVGNHDQTTLSTEQLASLLGYDSLHYTFDTKEFHCIVLHFKSPGNQNIHMPEGQFEWLREQLAAADKPVLVFSHQQIARHSLEDTYWFKGNPGGAFLQNGEEVHQLFVESGNVRAVFNGHMHWNNLTVQDDIPYFTVQSLIEDFKGEGTAAECYGVVAITDKEITVEVFGNDPAVLTYPTAE